MRFNGFMGPLCSDITIPGQLLDIVYQAIQAPLTVYLFFTPQTQSIELFAGYNVGKHRLDNTHAMTADLLPSGAICPAPNPVSIAEYTLIAEGKRHLSALAFTMICRVRIMHALVLLSAVTALLF
jgi:hypothetical protein